MRWFSRKPKPITPTTTDPWTTGFTRRDFGPEAIDAPMAQPLPQEVMGESGQLHRLIEGQIERMLPGLEDNHGHVLDEWLATQLASAVNALHEQVARQDAIADGLIRSAQDRAERARDRHRQHAERMHRLTAQLAELRHDLAPQRTTAPDALVPGETTSAARDTPAQSPAELPHKELQ